MACCILVCSVPLIVCHLTGKASLCTARPVWPHPLASTWIYACRSAAVPLGLCTVLLAYGQACLQDMLGALSHASA